jgi:hypothetical protein
MVQKYIELCNILHHIESNVIRCLYYVEESHYMEKILQ